MTGVLLGFHPLDKLGVEAEVVPDAVLPPVVRGREEREVCAGKTWFRENLNDIENALKRRISFPF